MFKTKAEATEERLSTRIKSAEDKIAKSEQIIVKKEKLIEKKIVTFRKEGLTEPEKQWEIKYLKGDINSHRTLIETCREAISAYRVEHAKHAAIVAEEARIFANLPPALIALRDSLVDKFELREKDRRDTALAKKATMSDYSWNYNATREERQSVNLTDADIRKKCLEEAGEFILELYKRVFRVTGEVADWSGIEIVEGSSTSSVYTGWKALNGKVVGRDGQAQLESVFCGGHNIQCRHIRIFVKPI